MFAIITLGLNIKFSLVAQPGIKQQKKIEAQATMEPNLALQIYTEYSI